MGKPNPTDNDPVGRQALARRALRANDVATMQHLADLDPALGRRLAARLIDQGKTPTVEYQPEPNPTGLKAGGHMADTIAYVFSHRWLPLVNWLSVPPPGQALRLSSPLRVPLLWSPKVAHLWACDCVSQCLTPNTGPRVVDAVTAARAFAKGLIAEVALWPARERVWAAFLQDVNTASASNQLAACAYRVCTDKYLSVPGWLRDLPNAFLLCLDRRQRKALLARWLGVVS